ncbi:hypothetical protein FPRO04_00312 [Fusarium proliferatum]|nr:hypothetical protein FPRO04_00312 [Fusarium proliferatum]
MKWYTLVLAASATLVMASPVPTSSISPNGPCPQSKVDAILKGDMDASECCSYGKCKGDVVISVGEQDLIPSTHTLTQTERRYEYTIAY